MFPDELVIAILTPPGRGAVATIGVEGELAAAVVGQCFQRRGRVAGDGLTEGRIAFGCWKSGDAPGEELVVCRRSATRIEIHCHGGTAASATILAELQARGARVVSWDEWCRRDEEDLLAAEARVALAEARTRRAAGMLLDQYRGALRRAVLQVMADVQSRRDAAARRSLEQLLQSAAAGLHLTVPFVVALSGRPNVGKSSLLNALAGYQRAIVSPEAGTTRDVVTAPVVWDGWRVTLGDTAGHRSDPHDPLEAAGIELARQQWTAADLVLLVTDASQPWSEGEAWLQGRFPAALIVHNKCDLVGPPRDGRPAGIAVSARTGEGIATLADQIIARLIGKLPDPGQAVPFLERHVGELQVALEAVKSHDEQQALAALWRLLGHSPSLG